MMRILLTGYGACFHHKLRDMSERASKQQDTAVNLLVSVAQNKFDEANDVVELVTRTYRTLEEVAESVSLDRIKALAGGEVGEVKTLLSNADATLKGLASDVDEAARMMRFVGGIAET
jgi:hypothetical protein